MFTYIYHCLPIFGLNYPDWTICAIIHGYIAFKRMGGYKKCHHECSLGVDLVINTFWYVRSDTLSLNQTLEQLAMYILHFKEFGDTESVVSNAVWVFI